MWANFRLFTTKQLIYLWVGLMRSGYLVWFLFLLFTGIHFQIITVRKVSLSLSLSILNVIYIFKNLFAYKD